MPPGDALFGMKYSSNWDVYDLFKFIYLKYSFPAFLLTRTQGVLVTHLNLFRAEYFLKRTSKSI